MKKYFIGCFAALALLSGFCTAPAMAAQVATFSDGRACSYTSLTVDATSGNVTIACVSSSPTAANFGITGPATMVASTATTVAVSRTAGPEEIVDVDYVVTGAGCTNKAATLSFASGGSPQSIVIDALLSGSCVITLTAPTGHTAVPDSVTITVDSAPAVPAECATPGSHAAQSLTFGPVLQLRMASGTVASFPIIAPQGVKHSIALTQGQQPETAAGTVTEMSISRCPGVIETTDTYCYRRSTFTNNNSIVAYTLPHTTYGWTDQATLGTRGCWAPSSEGTWYVNVRWTFATCHYGTGLCGFSMQWANGAY